MGDLQNLGEVIVFQAGDGLPRVDVHFEDETFWMSQQKIADLFQVSIVNVMENIQCIYQEGELSEETTSRVWAEGDREASGEITQYNLDMIISLSFRIRSAVATRFRQWASGRLKEYKKATRRSVARKLNLHENYFEPDYTLEDQDLADARYHWKMDQHYAGCADEIGLDEDFVRFIRNNELFSDMISNLQHIDVLLNSMDPRVPKTQSAFQFTTKVGERFYINEYPKSRIISTQ